MCCFDVSAPVIVHLFFFRPQIVRSGQYLLHVGTAKGCAAAGARKFARASGRRRTVN